MDPRLYFFLVIALSLLGGPVPAFAGVDLSGCEVNDQHIPTEIDESAERVAQATIMDGEFVIVANPYISYLGWETQRWLYLRQCAHIDLKHDIEALRAGKVSEREETEADCWAIEWLIKFEKFGQREVQSIERDLERLEAEEWRRLVGGPKRRTDLSFCFLSPA